jgi:hypothetical protein
MKMLRTVTVDTLKVLVIDPKAWPAWSLDKGYASFPHPLFSLALRLLSDSSAW